MSILSWRGTNCCNIKGVVKETVIAPPKKHQLYHAKLILLSFKVPLAFSFEGKLLPPAHFSSIRLPKMDICTSILVPWATIWASRAYFWGPWKKQEGHEGGPEPDFHWLWLNFGTLFWRCLGTEAWNLHLFSGSFPGHLLHRLSRSKFGRPGLLQHFRMAKDTFSQTAAQDRWLLTNRRYPKSAAVVPLPKWASAFGYC